MAKQSSDTLFDNLSPPFVSELKVQASSWREDKLKLGPPAEGPDFSKAVKEIEKTKSIDTSSIQEFKSYPKKSYAEMHGIIRKWLAITDDEWLDVILACALDRKIKGDPIWIFVVGVPSSTKTEITRQFADGHDFYQLSSLTPNSMISGFVKPDGKPVAGLAEQLDGKTLILKDFTSILSMSKDKRDEILGQLRELYDGELAKKMGNLDRKITVKCRVGLIACVTPVIDIYHSVMNQLGERFLKIRSDQDADSMLDMCVLNNGRETQMREELRDAIMGFLTNLEIDEEVLFIPENMNFLKENAKFLAKLRAPVYGRFEGDEYLIDAAPQPEKPTRIFKQLVKLTICLCNIRGLKSPDKRVLDAVRRVVLDSGPQDRRRVVEFLAENPGERYLISEITAKTKIPRSSLRRVLEGLNRLDMVERHGPGTSDSDSWSASTYTPLLVLGTSVPKNREGVELPLAVGVSYEQFLRWITFRFVDGRFKNMAWNEIREQAPASEKDRIMDYLTLAVKNGFLTNANGIYALARGS